MLEAVLEAIWIFFYTANITYWWWDCYPAPRSKSLSKGAEKIQFPGWDSSELLMSVDSCSPVSSTLVDRCLLVNALHLKLLGVSKKFYADCFGSELGLERSVFYSFLHHLGPWVSRHTTFLSYTAAIAVCFQGILKRGGTTGSSRKWNVSVAPGGPQDACWT